MKTNSFLLIVIMVLFIMACGDEEESACTPIDVPIEADWARETDCLNETLGPLLEESDHLRITSPEEMEAFHYCLENFPSIDFETDFLIVGDVETNNDHVIESQRLINTCEDEYILGIELRVTDFPTIARTYLFFIVPIDLVDEEMAIEIEYV
ncbi:hypothetical protein [Negadavirga shengliensis]|uniref:Protease complex subunit PrcB family protein n=1 Tax=Negadavirga shengliensis TaxID=1389218 RepID=A0ABV9T6F1_9BACT